MQQQREVGRRGLPVAQGSSACNFRGALRGTDSQRKSFSTVHSRQAAGARGKAVVILQVTSGLQD